MEIRTELSTLDNISLNYIANIVPQHNKNNKQIDDEGFEILQYALNSFANLIDERILNFHYPIGIVKSIKEGNILMSIKRYVLIWGL